MHKGNCERTILGKTSFNFLESPGSVQLLRGIGGSVNRYWWISKRPTKFKFSMRQLDISIDAAVLCGKYNSRPSLGLGIIRSAPAAVSTFTSVATTYYSRVSANILI